MFSVNDISAEFSNTLQMFDISVGYMLAFVLNTLFSVFTNFLKYSFKYYKC